MIAAHGYALLDSSDMYLADIAIFILFLNALVLAVLLLYTMAAAYRYIDSLGCILSLGYHFSPFITSILHAGSTSVTARPTCYQLRFIYIYIRQLSHAVLAQTDCVSRLSFLLPSN
jgi:hypothetical protein